MINAGPLEVLDPLRPHTLNALIWRRKRKMERAIRDLKDGMEEYEIKRIPCKNGFFFRKMRYLRVLWNSRQRHESWRDCVGVICNCMYGNEEENGVIDNVEGV